MNSQDISTFPPLSEEDIQFIDQHIDKNTDQLAFQLPRTAKSKFLLHQIQARKKIKQKLPTWYSTKTLILPPTLSLEQCSSEATAHFKKSLVGGQLLLDLTGGMGIDTSVLSDHFQHTFYFEQQSELFAITSYNFKALHKDSITCFHTDAMSYLLNQEDLQADWIYIDPARRDIMQRKVFHLSDCEPDVIQYEELLLKTAPSVLVKTSPVLDIELTIRQLHSVQAVYCIGYENECKEVLYILGRSPITNKDQIPHHAVVVDHQGAITNQISFTRQDELTSETPFSKPAKYLYEPHAAVLKSGALRYLCARYSLAKLAPNSHLYTSEELVDDFPGRIFTIKAMVKPDAKSLTPYLLSDRKANLTIRNFPTSVHELRKRLRLHEGGDLYLFATTLVDQQKVLLVTEKYARM